MKKATFILSFDCEGKWGMADILTKKDICLLTNKNLDRAYKRLISLLSFYDIKATFAFVGHLILSLDDYENMKQSMNFNKVEKNNWLGKFYADYSLKKFDGWLNPNLLEIVQSVKKHEIASHGFTHIPLSEKNIDKSIFFEEMLNMKNQMLKKNIDIKTLVYPRNIIGYQDYLEKYGIQGYRMNKPESSFFPRAINYINEIIPTAKAQNHSKNLKTIEIPSGYFLNWRSGIRKIPIELTLMKWESLLNDAIKNNKVVHLWTHPHNFISGENQFFVFEEILKMVSKLIIKNKITILTQKEYCEWIRNN